MLVYQLLNAKSFRDYFEPISHSAFLEISVPNLVKEVVRHSSFVKKGIPEKLVKNLPVKEFLVKFPAESLQLC